jgi:hypothetical protein
MIDKQLVNGMGYQRWMRDWTCRRNGKTSSHEHAQKQGDLRQLLHAALACLYIGLAFAQLMTDLVRSSMFGLMAAYQCSLWSFGKEDAA